MKKPVDFQTLNLPFVEQTLRRLSFFAPPAQLGNFLE